MTKGLKKVAKYVLENPQQIAIKSANDVASEVGVSETTVIRMCRELNYDGYSSFQREVRDYLLNDRSSLEEYQKGKQTIEDRSNIFEKVMNQDIDNIQRVIRQIDEDDFKIAVEKISNAKQVRIYGMRSSYGIGHWLTFTLNLFRENVSFLEPQKDDIVLQLSEMDERNVFIALSFHRYATETLKIAQAVKDSGGYVIGFTDSPIAPINNSADIVFPMNLGRKSTIDTVPVLMTLLNALIAGVSIEKSEELEMRRKKYESSTLNEFFVQRG